MDTRLEQVKKLQLLLLKYHIDLLPQGFENSEEKIQEIIQIIQEDQEFNDNLQCEVDKFLSIEPQQILQILDYDSHIQIKKEFQDKQQEYDQIQGNSTETLNKITETLKEIAIAQAYIHNNLIRNYNIILLMQDVNDRLNQIKAQANQEIENMETRYIQEIKSLKNPPQSVAKVAEIIVLFLYNSSQSNAWISFKQLIIDPNNFTRRLIEFKIEEVSQTPLSYARNAFERLNSEQMSRCNWCAYILHKWIQYQFQIFNVLNINKEAIEEFSNHLKALKQQEKIKDLKFKLQILKRIIKNIQIAKNLQCWIKKRKLKKLQHQQNGLMSLNLL